MTAQPAASPSKRYRFTSTAFQRLGESGAFDASQRLELLDGDIVELSPIGPKHAACVDALNALLVLSAPTSARVRAQNPIDLSAFSQPLPDIAVYRGDVALVPRHPRPSEIWLAIEVADTSLETDTRVKLPLYAAAGIPEVWIVDVNAETAEQYTEPAGDRYRMTKLHTLADTILCAELPQIAIPVRAMLPWIAQ